MFKKYRVVALVAGLALGGLALTDLAMAHHAMGGKTPQDWVGGLLSGLAHPLIGLDHLSFVVAIGLVSVGQWRGFLLPVAFSLGAIVGTGGYLQGWDLPGAEVMISASVVVFGLILAIKYRLDDLVNSGLGTGILAAMGAIAGLCHGYAYGEAIVGAGMMPLVAYLLGFSVTQLAIALGVYGLVARLGGLSRWLGLAGLAIAGLGVSFVWQAVTGA
ncbi:MAG: HupE/UreJ family protein [Pseudanabaenaceae cyanobacterium bins.68]|nr:HupE/UreJ family protein [Pseudanabaenaceae cyanobacterium bins.68]